MNLKKLIALGRVKPIHKTDGAGKTLLVGYERHANSRKAGQQYWLRTPVEVKS